MSSVKRYHDISPVTLQLVGGAVSSSLYCGEVEGLGGLAESFMVELYRCKVCQFTCGLKASISSHLQARHLEEGSAGGGADDGEEARLRRGASPYQDEDEDFLLYNMLDMSPPTCDISSEGGLHVAHTCEVSTLFEEEASMSPLKGGSGLSGPPMSPLKGGSSSGLSGPPEPSATQEQMAQSAHLMTLGLCRTSAAKPRSSRPPPEDSPCLPQPGSLKQSEARTRTRTRTRTRLACLLCPAVLPSRRLLDVHVRSHRAAGGFSCVCCSRAAASWEELEPHWRGHCRRKRRRRKRREQEEDKEKEKEKKKKEKKKAASGRFVCPVCLRSFRSAALRRTHQQTRHGDQPGGWRTRLIGRAGGKEAELPDSQTSRRPSVTETKKTTTKKKKKTKKKKTTTTKTTRSKEEEEGRGQERAFCCSLCHRKFSTKLTLRRHLGTHGGARPFTCPHCAYCSRLKASLLQHLRTHTGEKPYRCTECPYASIDRSSLLRHSRTHSQEKPYSCQHCDYSSIQKKSLDLHARRHHSGEAFPCQQCDYSSPDRQLLLRHVRRHHACDLTGERTL